MGPIELHGLYRRRPGSDTLVTIVHGLGGHCDSAYAIDAAIAVEQAGFSCLRLCLRGAQGSGEDFYHAGLTDDLRAALSDADFERYDHLLVIGFSLGGHVALRTAVEGADARLRAVAAVCPPLDLGAVQRWLDAPARKVYREYILRELRDMYAHVDRRGRAPTPLERVRQVRTLREWDALTVAPRYGFAGPDDYYRQMSVGPRLGTLQIPALLVASHHDPMIPAGSIEPLVRQAPQLLELCWVDDGGHVFFPAALDAGLGQARGVVPQALEWLVTHR
ncbi:alpha/beta fold hydrolase [Persicimonas caeni]|uniref:alpha/beta fold hydrolase n=1 Tax=Persicimonas caeni TaxID=2292766 RepID=UPI00143DC1E7|nr:alpha/beta fold hydrolase [Persicimonas caeni]